MRGFLKEKLGVPETASGSSTPPLREPTKNDNYEHSNETGTNEDKTSESHTADEGTASPDGGLAAAAAAHLERSGATLQSVGSSASEIDRQATQLTDWAKSNHRLLPEGNPGEVKGQGAEHEVFFRPSDSRMVKRTYPGTFGITPDVKGAQRAATPLFYLRRLELMNRVFGSDIRLEGVQMGNSPIIGKSGRQPAIVTSQRAYRPADPMRPHPSTSEIADFMRVEGFQPTPKSYFGWERPADGISVLDARPDNFIKTSEGVVPVDLVMDQKGPDAKSSGEAAAKAKGQSALTPGEQQDLRILEAMQKRSGLNPAQAARLAELQARNNLAGASSPRNLDITPTIERKLMPNGTPREQWRMEQIRKTLNLVQPALPGETPDAIFLGGGPGAGKTTVKNLAIAAGKIQPERDVTVAADDFTTGEHDVARAGAQGIPEYKALVDGGYPPASSVVRKEAGLMARTALRQAINERRSVVYDSTMRDYDRGAELIQTAKKAGYKTTMIGVAIDPKLAQQRALIRAAESGRRISEDALWASHAGFAQSFPRYLDLVDEAYLWDNNGKNPRLILRKTGNGIEILDKKAYHKFVKGEHETN